MKTKFRAKEGFETEIVIGEEEFRMRTISTKFQEKMISQFSKNLKGDMNINSFKNLGFLTIIDTDIEIYSVYPDSFYIRFPFINLFSEIYAKIRLRHIANLKRETMDEIDEIDEIKAILSETNIDLNKTIKHLFFKTLIHNKEEYIESFTRLVGGYHSTKPGKFPPKKIWLNKMKSEVLLNLFHLDKDIYKIYGHDLLLMKLEWENHIQRSN